MLKQSQFESTTPTKESFSLKRNTALAFTAGILAVTSACGGGGEKPSPSKTSSADEKVKDSDGNIVEFLIFDESDPQLADRDQNGIMDRYENLDNGKNKSTLVYNQLDGTWSDLNEAEQNESLAKATDLELSQIAEIEANVPDVGTDDYWKNEFLELGPVVQEVVVEVSRNSNNLSEEELTRATNFAFSYTAEEIENIRNGKNN
jgi:hypothetical protein